MLSTEDSVIVDWSSCHCSKMDFPRFRATMPALQRPWKVTYFENCHFATMHFGLGICYIPNHYIIFQLFFYKSGN